MKIILWVVQINTSRQLSKIQINRFQMACFTFFTTNLRCFASPSDIEKESNKRSSVYPYSKKSTDTKLQLDFISKDQAGHCTLYCKYKKKLHIIARMPNLKKRNLHCTLQNSLFQFRCFEHSAWCSKTNQNPTNY